MLGGLIIKLNPKYVGLLFLLIIGFKFTLGIENLLDVYWSDEGLYLYNGRFLLERKVAGHWGPIYSLWYKILSIFQNDPLQLYYLNYKIMVVLPGLFLFILFSKLEIGVIKSFVFSLFYIISYNNNTVWPKISSFCIIIIISNLIFIKYKYSKENKLFVSSILSLICAYIRPEFFLSFIIFTILLLYSLFKNSVQAKTIFEKIGSIFGLFLLLIVLFGYPISAERSFGAFGQHYAASNSDNDIDAWLNWENYTNKKFMGAKTLTEAFSKNPSEFLSHIFSNLLHYPGKLFDMLLEVIVPKILFSLPPISRLILLLSAVIIIYYCLALKKILFTSIVNSKQWARGNYNLLRTILIYLIPSTFAILINAPRQHYIMLQVPLLVLFISQVLITPKIKYKIVEFSFLLCLTIIFLFKLPDSSKYYHRSDSFIKNNVQFVENLKINKIVSFLHRESNLTFFLPRNYIGVDIDKLNKEAAYNIQNFDIIYLSSRLSRSNYLTSPPWIDFLANYSEYGYQKLIPYKGYPFLVKKTLILKSDK